MLRAALIATGTALITLSAGGVYAELKPGSVEPKYITDAVSDSARPADDTKRDSDRHPGLTLAFAGVKPGDTVAELAPGSGYYTRLLSAAVGPKGKVYALTSPRKPDAKEDPPVVKIAADPHYSNVEVKYAKLASLELPKDLDVVWTTQNYHDFHNNPDAKIETVNKTIFDALKPGGTYFVSDHVAEKGSGLRDTNTLHRIDPAAVKKEVTAAGFKYEGSSDILANSADPHTAKVFDPNIKGHTDQFIYKFRKPKK